MTLSDLHIDGETYSTVDLTKAGAYIYFDHPHTDIWCLAYAIGNNEPKLWFPGEPMPEEIEDHVLAGGRIVAWNAAFERLLWRKILTPRYGWIKPDFERQFSCTMAEAFALSLPGKLEKAAPALGLSVTKDEEGYRLMMQMCKPRKLRKKEACPECGDLTRECRCGPFWHNDPVKIKRLGEYCKQDVRTEVAIADVVIRLRPQEQEIFYLDAKINDRGVFIDAKLCEQANKIVDAHTEILDKELCRVTLQEVSSHTNTKQLTLWLNECGVKADSVAKDALADLLIRDDLPDDCRRALEIRQEAAKTSLAKIDKMLLMRGPDGRMRGNLQYHGAGTGRWAARGAQLQNLKRPTVIKGKTAREVEDRITEAVDVLMYGSPVLVNMLYDAPLTVVSDMIRSMITAGPGKDLLAADFSNIEGRIVAWLAGQEDKIDVFRACDEKRGPDVYLVTAAGIFGTSIKGAEPHRQIGKVSELSLGFQGGPGAFAKMSKNYNVKIGDHYDVVWNTASDANKEKALEAWPQRGRKTGMMKNAWLTAEVIKLAWRNNHPAIVRAWHELEDAAIAAMEKPGEITQALAGKIKYRKSGSFLFCRLPSGRAICYPYPRLAESEMSWGETKRVILYKCVNQITKRWEDKAFYGGLAMENVTQAAARDVMAEAMLRVEPKGYPIVLTIHDEILAEVPRGYGDLGEFTELMTTLPPWATGLPITAAGWRGLRYRKG